MLMLFILVSLYSNVLCMLFSVTFYINSNIYRFNGHVGRKQMPKYQEKKSQKRNVNIFLM